MTSKIFSQKTTKKNNDDDNIILTLTHSEALEVAHYILFRRNREGDLSYEIRDKLYRQIMAQVKQ